MMNHLSPQHPTWGQPIDVVEGAGTAAEGDLMSAEMGR